MKTLVVEDEFTCRTLLQTLLSGYGDCHAAVDGKEALDAVQAAIDGGSPYDLICMDILLPGMDGEEAVRRARALEEAHGILTMKGAKIVMTTSVSDVKKVLRCFSAGCDAYLMKPIDLHELLRKLESFQLLANGECGEQAQLVPGAEEKLRQTGMETQNQ